MLELRGIITLTPRVCQQMPPDKYPGQIRVGRRQPAATFNPGTLNMTRWLVT